MNKCGFEILPYCVDWSATGAMLGAVAVSLSAWVVVCDFKAWRGREVFSSKRDLAIEALIIFWEGKEVIYEIRSKAYIENDVPANSDVQNSSIQKAQNTKSLLDLFEDGDLDSGIICARINMHKEYWARLEKNYYKMKAVFGDEIANYLSELRSARVEIELACQSIDEQVEEIRTRVRKTLFRQFGVDQGDDKISARIKDAEVNLLSWFDKEFSKSI